MTIIKQIDQIKKLLPQCTSGLIEIVHQGYTGQGYADYRVELTYEQPVMTAMLTPARYYKGGDANNKRGVIANFPGGQSHWESDDMKGCSPSRVRTTRQWYTENKTAKADAELYVLLRNNAEELIRLAEIGLKVEEATK